MTRGSEWDSTHDCAIQRHKWPGWKLPEPVKTNGQASLLGWFFPEDWDHVPVNCPFRDDLFNYVSPPGTIWSLDIRPPQQLRRGAWALGSTSSTSAAGGLLERRDSTLLAMAANPP
eukprot:3310097-Pyramimonas_sp.AAC.1